MTRHSETSSAAIKNALDIVAFIGQYLPLHRAGSKFKALCPFHDDRNPSLEINPERQSYRCWSCGAGGDIFDFVQNIEHVDFPEAKRMLAERAGIVLESSPRAANRAVRPRLISWKFMRGRKICLSVHFGPRRRLGNIFCRGSSLRRVVERFRLGLRSVRPRISDGAGKAGGF